MPPNNTSVLLIKKIYNGRPSKNYGGLLKFHLNRMTPLGRMRNIQKVKAHLGL
jgi:hypothetical protein